MKQHLVHETPCERELWNCSNCSRMLAGYFLRRCSHTKANAMNTTGISTDATSPPLISLPPGGHPAA